MKQSVGFNGFIGGPRSMGRVGEQFFNYLLANPNYDPVFLPHHNDAFKAEWPPHIARTIPKVLGTYDQGIMFCGVINVYRIRCVRESRAWMYYEMTTLPDIVINKMNGNDRIIATSQFVKSVFLDNGVTKPIGVMGHGYDPDVYRYQRRSWDGVFEFLCIAEHTTRKNLPMLIDCFQKAFPDRKDVRLTLKLATHGEKDIRSHIKDPDRVRILTENLRTEAEMHDLYHSAHCFVLATRGEGFGMPILEAMATGLPVLVTNFSGHLDFCTPKNSYLIDNLGLVDSDPECFPHLPSQWGDPDPDHLVTLMREVVDNYDDALARAEVAYRDIKDDWTWAAQFAREYP